MPARNFLTPASFDLEKIKDQTQQAELLQWIERSSADSEWQPRIRKELARYKQHLPPAGEQAAKK